VRDQREPIDVRIDRKTDRRTAGSHEPLELAQILRNWFRRTGKAAVALEIDGRHDAAEPVEQRRHDHRAGAADAVQRDMKLPPANRLDVEVWYRKDTFDVSLDRTVVDLDSSECVPRGARDSLLDHGAHLGAFVALEKEAARPDELERIPLDRV